MYTLPPTVNPALFFAASGHFPSTHATVKGQQTANSFSQMLQCGESLLPVRKVGLDLGASYLMAYSWIASVRMADAARIRSDIRNLSFLMIAVSQALALELGRLGRLGRLQK